MRLQVSIPGPQVEMSKRALYCRIANDGLESIYPFIGETRKVDIPREDLIVLLTNNDPMNSPPIHTLSEKIQQQVADLSEFSNLTIFPPFGRVFLPVNYFDVSFRPRKLRAGLHRSEGRR